jgi:hypothetical protein
MHQHLRSFVVALATAALFFATSTSVLGGTTGSASGRVRDSVSEAPIAGAKVTAVSASQTAVDTTNPTGGFAFVSLVPDTYTFTVEHSGYNTLVVHGITVLADQTQTLTFAIVKSLVTLGRVEVRAAGGLVKPGTTSDVYSINASTAEHINALGGPGNLNQAYSAMVSVPGVNLPQAQQGWYQTVYIRGGDQDQVGWEFDGIPVNRSYDNAPMTFLSNLGQQELQVYTGGTPATSDASSISGYVNQVVKRGSYPGYADVTLGIGGPAMYNKGLIEFGGATNDNHLSYYIGTLGVNSNYRYINQQNGVGTPGFFYPLALNFNGQSASGIWSGTQANCSTPTASCFVASPGQSYAIAQTRDRETIGNFTLNLPHGNNPSLSDNLQFLYLTAEIWTFYNSSINDQGGPRYVYDNTNCLSGPAPCPGTGSPIPWQDGWIYSGPIFQPVALPNVTYYAFPSSPAHGSGLGMGCYPECATLGLDVRDVNDNGVSIEKLQYQRNISNSSYLRIFGYGVYSNWYINGPLSAFLGFGAEVGDYENLMSNYGGSISYANQLSDKHLINAGLFYSSGHSQRYSTTGGFPPCTADCSSSGGQASFITNLIDAAGNCYNSSGFADSCFSRANRGRFPGLSAGPMPYPAVGNALASGAQWIITSDGYHANVNSTRPSFSAVAVNDNWKPNDVLTFNIGLRVENYRVNYPDVSGAYPARAFWFSAYNREFCFGPALLSPVDPGFNGAGALNPCPAGTLRVGVADPVTNPPGGGYFSHAVIQPRFGFTVQANANDVIRGSAGLYARPASTREASWNTAEQNLPFLLGSDFLQYGFSTPEHDVVPDKSTNYDLSWEHHFPGTLTSFKVTPFYRSTQGQLQQLVVNALTGLFASFNAGRQISDGVEFALNSGSFSNNGFAAQFAYTYTRSQVQYKNFANGRNVIDNLNTYIQQYNGFTSACAGSTNLQCTASGVPSSKAVPCFDTAGNPLAVCGPGNIANPYFMLSPQPLFDRNGWYSTYDLIPAPFAGANGFATPNTATLILNYKRDKWSFTPSVVYSSGAKYGSPVVWPGYDPSTCSAVVAGNTADTTTCGGNIFIPDFYTGKFDNLGDFNEPSRITVNMQIAYAASSRVNYALTLTNIVDTCMQRGYKWDRKNVCVYSSLPSSILPPVGNFADPTAATTPDDLRFPYAVWLNNNNTGFVGTTLPFQASFEVNIKL